MRALEKTPLLQREEQDSAKNMWLQQNPTLPP